MTAKKALLRWIIILFAKLIFKKCLLRWKISLIFWTENKDIYFLGNYFFWQIKSTRVRSGVKLSLSIINLTLKRKLDYEWTYNNNENSDRLRCKLRKTDAYEANTAMDQFEANVVVLVYSSMDHYCKFKQDFMQNDYKSQILRHQMGAGWFNCCKECHNISLRSIQCESNDVDPKTVKDQKAKINKFFEIFFK